MLLSRVKDVALVVVQVSTEEPPVAIVVGPADKVHAVTGVGGVGGTGGVGGSTGGSTGGTGGSTGGRTGGVTGGWVQQGGSTSGGITITGGNTGGVTGGWVQHGGSTSIAFATNGVAAPVASAKEAPSKMTAKTESTPTKIGLRFCFSDATVK